ncbi:MAG: tetratricopeptide repeat protein [Opitutaceae bacterium]|jgi:hypothetical protein
MNNRTRILPVLSIFAALLLAWPPMAVAQPTNADFQQAVAEYQQSPSFGTYEKIIKMAVAMNQLPPIPSEAQRRFVRGATLFKDAQTPDDFKQASDEFSQAIRLAPWWPDALYNLALAQGAAGDYASAIADLKWYQRFKLSEAEADAAQKKIWGFEAKQEKAAKDKELAAEKAARDREMAAQKAAEDQRAQQEAAAANKVREQEEFLRKIDGARYSCTVPGTDDGRPIVSNYYFDIRGDTIMWSRERVQGPGAGRGSRDILAGRIIRIYGREVRLMHPDGSVVATGVISADGSTILFDDIHLYKRER